MGAVLKCLWGLVVILGAVWLALWGQHAGPEPVLASIADLRRGEFLDAPLEVPAPASSRPEANQLQANLLQVSPRLGDDHDPAESRIGIDDDTLEVSFFELTAFDYPLNEDTTIPSAIRELDGERVVIFGYMIPLDYHRKKVRKFFLSATLSGCCFGNTPKLNEIIEVEMAEGIRLFAHKWVKVTGRFGVGETLDLSGAVANIYRLDGDSVDGAIYR